MIDFYINNCDYLFILIELKILGYQYVKIVKFLDFNQFIRSHYGGPGLGIPWR